MKRKKTFLFSTLLFVVLVVLAFYAIQRRHQVRYTITDLGSLGGGYTIPVSINKQGHVVGASNTTTGSQHVFLWSDEGGTRDIGSFFPHGMNDRDEIVGHVLAGGTGHACLWTPTEGLIDLGTIDGGVSAAYGINKRSEVVGTSNQSGFIWTATGGMEKIRQGWSAYDINDAGQILCSTHSNRTEPFLYSRVQDEVIPPEDLNSPLKFPYYEPQRSWSRQGGKIRSCVPFFSTDEQIWTRAKENYVVGISDSNGDQTIGFVHYENPYLESAFSMRWLPRIFLKALDKLVPLLHLQYSKAILWEGGEAIYLTNHIPPENEWTRLIEAKGINQSGQITGFGAINGECHAFLLNPIKESTDGD